MNECRHKDCTRTAVADGYCSDACYLDDRRFVDGPGFVRWLESEFGEEQLRAAIGESSTRRLWDWQQGKPAAYATVDRILVKLGMNLDADVPEDLWLIGRDRQARRLDPTARRMIEEMFAAGKTPREVAEAVGCSVKTARRYKRDREDRAEVEAIDAAVEEVEVGFQGLDRGPDGAWYRAAGGTI